MKTKSLLVGILCLVAWSAWAQFPPAFVRNELTTNDNSVVTNKVATIAGGLTKWMSTNSGVGYDTELRTVDGVVIANQFGTPFLRIFVTDNSHVIVSNVQSGSVLWDMDQDNNDFFFGLEFFPRTPSLTIGRENLRWNQGWFNDVRSTVFTGSGTDPAMLSLGGTNGGQIKFTTTADAFTTNEFRFDIRGMLPGQVIVPHSTNRFGPTNVIVLTNTPAIQVVSANSALIAGGFITNGSLVYTGKWYGCNGIATDAGGNSIDLTTGCSVTLNSFNGKIELNSGAVGFRFNGASRLLVTSDGSLETSTGGTNAFNNPAYFNSSTVFRRQDLAANGLLDITNRYVCAFTTNAQLTFVLTNSAPNGLVIDVKNRGTNGVIILAATGETIDDLAGFTNAVNYQANQFVRRPNGWDVY